MALEHVWVECDDKSLVRGDQVVGFTSRGDGDGESSNRRWSSRDWDGDRSYYVIEVFGSGGDDRFRRVLRKPHYPMDEAESYFIRHLYAAAATASEGKPVKLVTTPVEDGSFGTTMVDV
jgi:hypothetical protein